MLVIYFGRDLTEGFTLILAVKMKVHKLLYFYWSLPTYLSTLPRASAAREGWTTIVSTEGRKGKGRRRKCGKQRLYCRSLDKLARAREGSLAVWCICRAKYSRIRRTKIFVFFFSLLSPPRWIFQSLWRHNEPMFDFAMRHLRALFICVKNIRIFNATIYGRLS